MRYEKLLGFVAVLTLLGCKSEPGEFVPDPRSFLIEKLSEASLDVWWEPYGNTDLSLVEKVVDDFLAKQQQLGREVPTDSNKLERNVVWKLKNHLVWSQEESEEGREFIQTKAQSRFDDPPVTQQKHIASVDFHYLPGEWQDVSKTTKGMVRCPAIENFYLTQAAMIHAVAKATAKHPDAKVVDIEYRFFHGASRHSGWYRVHLDGTISRRWNTQGTQHTAEEFSMDEVLAGNLDINSLKWEGEWVE